MDREGYQDKMDRSQREDKGKTKGERNDGQHGSEKTRPSGRYGRNAEEYTYFGDIAQHDGEQSC